MFEVPTLFFDDSVMDIIILETNIYAKNQPGKSTTQWRKMNKNEIKKNMDRLLQ